MTSTAKSNVSPINETMCDVSLIPARIAERLQVIIARHGFEIWPVEHRDRVMRWANGGAPATWTAWASVARVEVNVRKLVTRQTSRQRRPFKPMIATATGELVPAPPTARQRAKRQHAKASWTSCANLPSATD